MSQDFRPHVVMGIIILILALALIVLSFIPRQIQIRQSPGSVGQNPSYSQQTSTVTHSSLAASGLLVIPPLTLS